MFSRNPVSSISKVLLITSHGKIPLSHSYEHRVIDCLTENHIPWSSVTLYKHFNDSNYSEIFPCLDVKLSEIPENQEVHAYYNRNIDPNFFINRQLNVIPSREEKPSSEFIYKDYESASGGVFLKKLTPEECQECIISSVSETLDKYLIGDSVIVGVSGGGDSNALLNALSNYKSKSIKIYPVILKGIPDWDEGVPRAQELCRKYNLELKIIEPEEVKKILGTSQEDLVSSFEKHFPGDDFEFLGTLMIRLSLLEEARRLGVKNILLGLNLDDLLAEHLYRISNGKIPLPTPTREFENAIFIYPLWQSPKKIIDGCFPKFSLENYNVRYPGVSLGRNLFYQLAYTIQSQFPGIAEKLVAGCSHVSQAMSVKFNKDSEFGFEVLGDIPLPVRNKFTKFLKAK
ncbi:MAG: hypothetical protein K0M45_00705 [Candidatus Paracaedibacteraceae bacterium]|nr:hypothetical protein [Candidatus Paracaedibacteraceae bacterium]